MWRRLSLIVFISTLVACSSTSEHGPAKKLILLYSGNIGGQKNPCGCSPTMGGYARKATVIKALHEEYAGSPFLFLDSGAMLFSNNFLVPPLDIPFRLDAPITASVMGQLGLDAINVSRFDLANSVDSLAAIAALTPYPWLSANLVHRDSEKLVFTPDTVLVRGNVTVGVFGLLTDTFDGAPIFEGTPFGVLDKTETAKREISSLDPRCDLVIALAYMSLAEAKAVIDKAPGIDILILSHNNYHNPSSDHNAFAPITHGDTVILRCPDGGRVLGVAEITLEGKKPGFHLVSENERYDRSPSADTARTTSGSTLFSFFIDLGPEVPADSTIQRQLDVNDPFIKAYQDSITSR